MKRALLGTLWIGAVAAGVALALQSTGWLARPAAALARAMALSPNEPMRFGNVLLVLLLGFAVAWTMSQVADLGRRALLFILFLVELLGAAWVLRHFGITFPPLPAAVAVVVATLLAVAVSATRTSREGRATARLFGGRLAQPAHDRLAENGALDLSQPIARQASFVFCEIANEADLVEELSPAACAQLTREFIDCATDCFLREGGYLHAADGEGIRVFFGFPNPGEEHALEAARAALAFRDFFQKTAIARPDSLGKIDLRIGISSGTVVATLQHDAPGSEIVVAGEPLEIARRLARANQTYGSHILVDPRTFSAAGKEILARPLDFLRSGEAHERLEVYELLALAAKATPEEVARRDRFWTGIVYFRERRWNDAWAEFEQARNGDPERDRPLQWYLRQIEALRLPLTTGAAPAGQPLAPLS